MDPLCLDGLLSYSVTHFHRRLFAFLIPGELLNDDILQHPGRSSSAELFNMCIFIACLRKRTFFIQKTDSFNLGNYVKYLNRQGKETLSLDCGLIGCFGPSLMSLTK